MHFLVTKNKVEEMYHNMLSGIIPQEFIDEMCVPLKTKKNIDDYSRMSNSIRFHDIMKYRSCKNLFHVSTNPNLSLMYPRVPKNRLHNEEGKTKRICMSTNIDGCIEAMPLDYIKNNDVLFVYVPVNMECVYISSVDISNFVHDSIITNELWVRNKKLRVKCIGAIKVNKIPVEKQKLVYNKIIINDEQKNKIVNVYKSVIDDKNDINKIISKHSSVIEVSVNGLIYKTISIRSVYDFKIINDTDNIICDNYNLSDIV